jgi:GNAT superfamily N-acetyltransferase
MTKQSLFTIRGACHQDMPLCARIWCAEKQTFPWPEAAEIHDFYRQIEGETLFVAEYSGTVVVFIPVYALDSFTHHLFVTQEYSRLGIGSALLTHAMERFPKPITLKCVIWNRSACLFCQRNGWKKTTTCEHENPPYHVFSYA